MPWSEPGTAGRNERHVEPWRTIAMPWSEPGTAGRNERPVDPWRTIAMPWSEPGTAGRNERQGDPCLQDVDREIDHDPHDVDEVPVDPGHLHAAMLLLGEVPAERADRRERQQREADEHVRAVQAGEPVEDRALRVVVRREADVHVLVDLHREEGGAQKQRRGEAGPH